MFALTCSPLRSYLLALNPPLSASVLRAQHSSLGLYLIRVISVCRCLLLSVCLHSYVSMCLCVYMCVKHCVCLSVCLLVVCLAVGLYVSLSLNQSVYICLSACLRAFVYLDLSVNQSVCLSVCLSVVGRSVVGLPQLSVSHGPHEACRQRRGGC